MGVTQKKQQMPLDQNSKDSLIEYEMQCKPSTDFLLKNFERYKEEVNPFVNFRDYAKMEKHVMLRSGLIDCQFLKNRNRYVKLLDKAVNRI